MQKKFSIVFEFCLMLSRLADINVGVSVAPLVFEFEAKEGHQQGGNPELGEVVGGQCQRVRPHVPARVLYQHGAAGVDQRLGQRSCEAVKL